MEEAIHADLLLIVTDASNPDSLSQRRVVQQTLDRLGAGQNQYIEVLNKCDSSMPTILDSFPDAIHISALNGDGLDELKNGISSRLSGKLCPVVFRVPYQSMNLVPMIHDICQNVEVEYADSGAVIKASADQAGLNRILKAAGSTIQCEVIRPADLPEDITPSEG